MTEEEMIDLALRLSEQEASIVAIRRQKEEEEAMMKALRESVSRKSLTVCKCGLYLSHLLEINFQPGLIMNLNRSRELIMIHNEISQCFVQMSHQDLPCPLESQSLLDDTDAPSNICTRRRLTYSNGRSTSAVGQGASDGGCTSEKNQKRGEAPNSAAIFLTPILLASAQRGAFLSRISKKQNIFLFVGLQTFRNKTQHGGKYDESKA